MIPGLGGCKVQRDDLIFDLASTIETRPGALKTLTIGFNKRKTQVLVPTDYRSS
ncbi:hypothetical protein Pcac1_g22051 [Phytophthora cactorum]|nr:hypothetical protein Pcac1_g22051 [Phytophthora cactorum]KAG2816208.1 hypothetical protein PC112_g13561 [Phytophthora cactorum]KAG2818075.1 hypothetical protein PC111_g12451 [Phytophthora cactorum]KAG2858967.1 hypothetical protein PC113_g9360 [Phytophthora cactorum]KAG2897308.1 hypothetical protein PC114_g14732 [Phytophthora cactorum]